MGFFKKLFKRKRGGTFVGNLIRGIAHTASGGLLGNGKDLAAWEAKQDQKEHQAFLIKQNNASSIGSTIGNSLKPHIQPAQKQVENAGAKLWLKRNWWKVSIPLVALIIGIFFLARRKKKSNKW